MDRFDHEKLDVYQVAVDWVSLAQDIAEGAGEFSGAEKARFYRIAKRSATECAAVLDVATRRSAIAHEHYAQGRSQLLRIVGMLVKLVRSHS